MTKENKPLVSVGEGKKTYKDCGRTLPADQFHKNRWGYTFTCRECYAKKQSAIQKEIREKTSKKEPETTEQPTQHYAVTGKDLDAKAKEAKHNAMLLALTVATDQELAAELGRRGYKGTLHKDLNFSE